MTRIQNVALDFEREPLAKPFGFKGGYVTRVWQTIVGLKSESGNHAVGLGTQSVLWSDPDVSAEHTEQGGNVLMMALTEYALGCLRGTSFDSPMDLFDDVLDAVLAYGRSITGHADLRTTFALNALVPVDIAIWLLHARETGITSFDQLLPEPFRAPFSHRNDAVARVPVVSYNTPDNELEALFEAGAFIFKIKLGAPGAQADMLAQDKQRISHLHHLLGSRETPHTPDGQILYYLDANGRYESKDTLLSLLDHMDRMGAMDRVVVLEEPFPETLLVDVKDVGVPLAADESAHTDRDAALRIDLGYSAIALKPIAKSISMTLKIAELARENGVPCFCADLTVNPVLVEWNKAFAARLAPFPGLGLPMMEMNGVQNYRDWDRMKASLPDPKAPWVDDKAGLFHLGDEYYARSSDLFVDPPHYTDLVM